MSDWDWFHQARSEFWQRGDQERLRLADWDTEAFALRETDPHQAEHQYRAAAHLARQLGEPWFEFLYELRRVQMVLYFERDYTRALDLAISCALLPRRPDLTSHPKRYYAWIYLLDTYLFIDPLGYAAEIQQTLNDLENSIAPQVSTNYYLYLESVFSFAMARRAYDEAATVCQLHLSLVDQDHDKHRAAWHGSCAYISLCWINQRRQRLDDIAGHARAGEELARTAHQERMAAESQLWQAVHARHTRDEKNAQRFLRQGLSRLAAIQSPPWDTIFDAQAAFHELTGDWDKALAVREQQLRSSAGRGQLASDCDAHIERCKLLRHLGRLTAEDLAQASAAAAKLRKPAWYREQIAALEA